LRNQIELLQDELHELENEEQILRKEEQKVPHIDVGNQEIDKGV
jgi:hypothetical protein